MLNIYTKSMETYIFDILYHMSSPSVVMYIGTHNYKKNSKVTYKWRCNEQAMSTTTMLNLLFHPQSSLSVQLWNNDVIEELIVWIYHQMMSSN